MSLFKKLLLCILILGLIRSIYDIKNNRMQLKNDNKKIFNNLTQKEKDSKIKKFLESITISSFLNMV